jgi:serine/threonine protein kinase/tetratricopeptide (TPR) repeat protein
MSEIMAGPFRLLDKIGKGGMAEVWRAQHPDGVSHVAVKVVSARLTAQPDFVDAFADEVRAVAGLNHPGVVVVMDQGELDDSEPILSSGVFAPGSPWLAMELATGGTLADLFPMSRFAQLKRALLDILDALSHAHARGVIHRDLKPQNVLISGGDQARLKLTDFGIARALDGSLDDDSEHEESLQGTPYYMAPEQVEGRWRDQGPWTDLYAVGCLAWFGACGRHAFTGDMIEILRGHLLTPAPPIEPRFEAPEGFAAWVARLMEKSPSARFQHAADAAIALLALGSRALPSLASLTRVRTPGEPSSPLHESLSTRDGLESLGIDQETVTSLVIPSALRPTRPDPPRTWRRSRPSTVPTILGAGLGLYGLRPVPMVGRERERDVVWEALQRVCHEAAPRAVALRGLLGTGKTRLAQWCARRAAELGCAEIVWARHTLTPTASSGIPYALASRLRCLGLATPQVHDRVHAWLVSHRVHGRTLDYHTDALTALIAPTCRPTAQSGGAFSFSSDKERVDVLAFALELIAEHRPIALVIDDAQWGPQALALASVALERADLPILFLITVREEHVGDVVAAERILSHVSSLERTQTLEIGALSPDEHRALIANALGLRDSFVERVRERTDGNPLFAIQLIGDLVERGELLPSRDGLAPAPGSTLRLPDGLHEVWDERVAHLLHDHPDPDGARHALEVAAALGARLSLDEWSDAAQRAAHPVDPRLFHAVRRSPLFDVQGQRLAFVHGMLRESVARTSQSQGRWANAHLACARCVQERYGAESPAHAQRLVHHLTLAGQRADAVSVIQAVAPVLRRRGELDVLEDLLVRHRALADRLGDQIDPRAEADALFSHALILWERGDRERALSILSRLEVHADSRGWGDLLAFITLYRGFDAYDRGNPAETAAHMDAAARLARRAQAPYVLMRAHAALGELSMYTGDLDAAGPHLQAALDIASQGGFAVDHARALSNMGHLATLRGDLAGARGLLTRALDHARRTGSPANEATVLEVFGELERACKDLPAAVSHYEAALSLLEMLRAERAALTLRLNLVICLVLHADYPAARDAAISTRHALRRQGISILIPFTHAAVACCDAAARADAPLKRHLAVLEKVDPASLPFRSDMVSLLERLSALCRAGALHGPLLRVDALTAAFSDQSGTR